MKTAEFKQKIRAWRDDSVLFVRECLGAEPDAWQVEVLNAAKDNIRIALNASKGPGKTTVLAWLAWWFMLTRSHPKVICTSIDLPNLKDGLWPELAKWRKRSRIIDAAFVQESERIKSKEHPETWFISARTWAKQADTQQQAEALAGIHADHIMFLLDEAGGIPDAVSATAEAGLTGAEKEQGTEAYLIIAGNPSHLEGPLYRACTTERDLWWVKSISGDPDDPQRAPRVSIQWARDQIRKYGRDNPWVRVNVFGLFPLTQHNKLLGPEEVEAAMRRQVPFHAFNEAPKILGVDVARFGDDKTVLFPRQGKVGMRPIMLRGLHATDVSGRIIQAMKNFQPDAVFIDDSGVGGAVLDRMTELGHVVTGVQFGGKSSVPGYKNKRSQMWGMAAKWVKEGGCLPDEPELLADLTAPLFWFESDSSFRLESKADIKKRLGHSPDCADSFVLTFAEPVAPKWNPLKPWEQEQGRVLHEYNPYAMERV